MGVCIQGGWADHYPPPPPTPPELEQREIHAIHFPSRIFLSPDMKEIH